MTVYGGQHATLNIARQELYSLQEATSRLWLPPQAKEAAHRSLRAAQEEASKPNPNKRKVAAQLEEYADILQRAGALAQAGEAVARPLWHLAEWLGPFGNGLRTLFA